MDDRTAGTSSAIDVEFDDDFITKARHMPVEQLMIELAMLENETHPLLATVMRKKERDQLIQEDRIRCHRERAELKARNDYATKDEEIRQEFETRIGELLEEARKRADDLERAVHHDYGNIDINKPLAIPLVFESNKKTLRGRGGGQLIEPLTYFNANQSNRIPEMNYKLAFDDARIKKDLDSIMNRTDARRKIVYTVSIQKPRLIIDSKGFKHGEDVYASNSTFGEFLAKIDIVNEKMIQLKGVKNWDTRQISATLEDLEEARVTITKQRGKDRGF